MDQDPFVGSNDPFPGAAWTIENIGIYIMIHNSSKITVMSRNEHNFTVGVTTRGTVLKGCSIREAKNHCSRVVW